MNQKPKTSGRGYFSNRMFGSLKLAIVGFAAAIFLCLNLFQLPSVELFPSLIFHDTTSLQENFFYSYFLDFSNVLSSVFIVLSVILTIGFIIVFLNYYLHTGSSVWLFSSALVAIIFYFCISLFSPLIQKFESRYIGGSAIEKAVYFGDYIEAYHLISEKKMSETERAYMNSQVSMFRYIDNKSKESLEHLNADVRSMQYLVRNSDNGTVFYNNNVVYTLYKKSTIQGELSDLSYAISEVNKKTYIYICIILILFGFSSYHLNRYRVDIGF